MVYRAYPSGGGLKKWYVASSTYPMGVVKTAKKANYAWQHK